MSTDLVGHAGPGGAHALPRVTHLDEVVRLASRREPLYVRVSAGPAADRSTISVDHEYGCVLPGLSAWPLHPEPWWDQPVEQWVARALARYEHLLDDPDRFPWLLRGEESGRGPDCEPLLVAVHPVAVVDAAVVTQAVRARTALVTARR